MSLLRGHSTRANQAPDSPQNRIHKDSDELRRLKDDELQAVGTHFVDTTLKRKRIAKACLYLSVTDLGAYDSRDKGFELHSFTRADLALKLRPQAWPVRLQTHDIEALEWLVSISFLAKWKQPREVIQYRGADGTMLSYGAGYELRYQVKPAAAVWWLLQTKAADRVRTMLAYR